jgi:hypothetical protein
MSSQPHSLEDRILKLENQNRRLKQFGIAVLIIPTLFLIMAQAPSSKTVEADRFILRDGNGVIRAAIVMAGGQPDLSLFDEKGMTRLSLSGGAIEDGGKVLGGGLTLYDSHHRVRADFTAEDDSAFLQLYGLNPDDPIRTTVTEAGLYSSGRVHLVDADGFEASLGAANLITPLTGETHKTSAASLILFGKDKNVIWKAP